MVLWMLRPHTPGCHKPKLYNPETLIFCIMCAPPLQALGSRLL